MRALIVLCLLLFSTSAHALTVSADGTISCGPGLEPAWWQEDDGMDPMWRAVMVDDYDRFGGYLVYEEWANRSVVLKQVTAGTNINWRGLTEPNGESYGAIRALSVDTSQTPGDSDYDGKTVKVLVINMKLFWPICARTTTVEQWFEAAEK